MKLLLVLSVLISCICIVWGQRAPAIAVTGRAPATDSMAYFCDICGNACDTVAYQQPGVCPHCGMNLVYQSRAARKKLLGNQQQSPSVCFYLQDGIEVLDFAGPMEVFTDAGFHVFTVSKKKEPIKAQGVLTIMPDYSIEDAPPADILAFFGGNTGPSSNDAELISWIKSRKASTQYFFSVCTGAFIMGRAGILDGLTATTFHSSIEDLRKALPSTKVLSGVRFVDNGTVITTAGISAGIDGALHLVTKLQGEELARQTVAYMEYDKWVPGQGLVVK
jgi:transcriptional regulator GlxA family with amidase domain/DNA-directed RNA polymerase subunit RPC12/RpoP